MSIQRYRFEEGWRTVLTIPDDRGGYVRYDDHEAELAAEREARERAEAVAESSQQAQRHAETELSQYMAWYAMAEHQHLHEQRRAEKAAEERDALRTAVMDALAVLASGNEFHAQTMLRAALGER